MAKLKHVNTTDIRDAILLGCRTMTNVFDADDDNRPFFGSQVLPEARLSFNAHCGEAHVPGRHLNALRGDEVKEMDNFGADLTYFDAYDSLVHA